MARTASPARATRTRRGARRDRRRMRLPYQKSAGISEIWRARGAILRPVRPLCAFDLDHTLVRSPLDLVRLKGEIRALVEAEGLPLPEATRAWTIGQIIEAADGPPDDARRGVLGALHDARGGGRRTRPARAGRARGPHRAPRRGLSPRALDQQHGIGRAPGPRELRAMVRRHDGRVVIPHAAGRFSGAVTPTTGCARIASLVHPLVYSPFFVA